MKAKIRRCQVCSTSLEGQHGLRKFCDTKCRKIWRKQLRAAYRVVPLDRQIELVRLQDIFEETTIWQKIRNFFRRA